MLWPNSPLTITITWESSGEKLSIIEINYFSCLWSLMAFPGCQHSASSGLNNADLFIFARCGAKRTITIPRKAVDSLWVAVYSIQYVTSAGVPNENQMVKSNRSENGVCSWVPLNVTDPTKMALETDERLREASLLKTFVRYVPKLDCAIIWARSNHVIVERVPFDIEHWSAMTADAWVIDIDPSSLVKIYVRFQQYRSTIIGNLSLVFQLRRRWGLPAVVEGRERLHRQRYRQLLQWISDWRRKNCYRAHSWWSWYYRNIVLCGQECQRRVDIWSFSLLWTPADSKGDNKNVLQGLEIDER